MTSIFLSVIIPSYNEKENLQRGVLSEVRNYLSKQKYTWEVIVSDDGSPDEQSRQLAKDFCQTNKGFAFLENSHGGKPLALWAGIQKASGQVVLISDMDQSTPVSESEKLLEYYKQNFDIVIGSRGVERKNSSLFRQLASVVFRTFRRSIILPQIIDTQCCFKSAKKAVFLDVFPRLQIIKQAPQNTKGWTVGSWDAEFLFIAIKYGYKIKEVPVLWENRDQAMGTKESTSKGQFVKESLDMVKQIFRVRINDLKGFYEK